MKHAPALVIVCGLLPGVAQAQHASLDASLPGWSRLEFRARKLALSMSVEVSLDVVPAAAVVEDLAVKGDHDFLEPEGDRVVGVKMSSRGLGRPADSLLWVRAADGTALYGRQTETGRRKRFRVNRFARDGVWQMRRTPVAGEEDLPVEQWSAAAGGFIDLAGRSESGGLTDPLALFFIATGGGLEKPGDELVLPVFAKGEVITIRAAAVETVLRQVDYVEMGPDGRREQKGPKELLEVRIGAASGGRGKEESEFVFLGLRGDVRLWIDPATRAIVEVAGRVPVAGGVRVRLRSVTLKPELQRVSERAPSEPLEGDRRRRLQPEQALSDAGFGALDVSHLRDQEEVPGCGSAAHDLAEPGCRQRLVERLLQIHRAAAAPGSAGDDDLDLVAHRDALRKVWGGRPDREPRPDSLMV